MHLIDFKVKGEIKDLYRLCAFALLVCLVYSRAGAQSPRVDLNHYKPLVSSGTIPVDFLEFYLKSSEFDTLRAEGKQGEKFREENTVVLGELFATGKVLLNDPLGAYAQRVLDTLLSLEPSLKGRMRVYALRSAEANAFTSNDGKIFITTGFLANLESEAQLAYVLAHEAVHYRNNHLYRDFVFRSKADASSLGGYRYSREHESEADIEGLRILMRSHYSVQNIDWVLDVLFNSYLPVDNIPLDRKFFEASGFSIPDSCFLQDSTMGDIGNAEQDYNDMFQTHPSIASRKKEIRTFIGDRGNDPSKKQFLLSEDDFFHMRNIARFELSYQYYLEGRLEESIYNSYVMLQEFPGNSYLEKMMAGALFALSSSRKANAGQGKPVSDHTKLEGYQRQFSYMFSKMSDVQMHDMTRFYVEKIYRRQPGNRDLRQMVSLLRNEPPPVLFAESKFNVKEGMLLIPEITVEDNASRKSPVQAYHALHDQLNKINGEKEKALFVALDPYTLHKDSINAYNEWVLINDWLTHKLKNTDGAPFIEEEQVQKLMLKRNVGTVALASITVTENSMRERLLPFGWLVVPYLRSKYSVSYMMIAFEKGKTGTVTTYSLMRRSSRPHTSKKKLAEVLLGEQ
jgi:hypothetical protein